MKPLKVNPLTAEAEEALVAEVTIEKESENAAHDAASVKQDFAEEVEEQCAEEFEEQFAADVTKNFAEEVEEQCAEEFEEQFAADVTKNFAENFASDISEESVDSWYYRLDTTKEDYYREEFREIFREQYIYNYGPVLAEVIKERKRDVDLGDVCTPVPSGVYLVEYYYGKKLLIPIYSKEELLSVINSKRNRENYEAFLEGKGPKTALVQLVFSCHPNEDGTLKGTKLLTNNVVFDCDDFGGLTFEEVCSRFDNIQDPRYKEVCRKKSASGKLHVIFRRRKELTQEQNLQWVSELTGIAYDKCAKDHTRVLFTVPDSILYLDRQVFDEEELPLKEETKQKVAKDFKVSEPKDSSFPTSFKGIPYEAIIKEYWKQTGGEPVVGERNTRLYGLALALRGICDNNVEFLLSIMPNYGLDENEMHSIVSSACKESVMGQTKGMKEILSTLAHVNQTEATAAKDMAPMPPARLPRVIHLLTKVYEKPYRPMLMPVASAVLGCIASHFHAIDEDDKKEFAPNLFVALIGESGSCKSYMKDVYDTIAKNTIAVWDRAEYDKLDANLREREEKVNSKDKPAKYHPKLIKAERISQTSILDLSKQQGENGCLMLLFTEADALTQMRGQAYMNPSVFFRKAFDGDEFNQYYFTDSSFSGRVTARASCLLSGTPKAVLGRVFDDTEGGFMQRFIPVLSYKSKEIRRPRKGVLTEAEQAELDAMITGLWQKNLDLGEGKKIIPLPRTAALVDRWIREKEDARDEGLLLDAESSLSHRIPLYIYRAALSLVALEGKETKEILDYAKWIGDFAFYYLCKLFSMRLEQDQKTGQRLLEGGDRRKTAESVINQMPSVFSKKELVEKRISLGQSKDCNKLLRRYCKQGKLRRLDNGFYMKVESEAANKA